MSVGNVDVLQVNLVLVDADLVNDAEAVSKFYQAVLEEITTGEGDVAPGLRGRRHEIRKDRITVVWDASMSVIAREYPRQADLERFAHVASAAISSTDLTGQILTTYGYNIDIVYDVDPPQAAVQYLGDRVFVQDIFHNRDRRLLGGFGRVSYAKNDLHWNAIFEPRGLDLNAVRIFFSLNMMDLNNQEGDVLFPTKEEILDSVRLLWEEAHDFVNQLDGSNAGG